MYRAERIVYNKMMTILLVSLDGEALHKRNCRGSAELALANLPFPRAPPHFPAAQLDSLWEVFHVLYSAFRANKTN